MNKLKLGNKIIWIGMIFWLIETWHFGWNITPINNYELTCDFISTIIIIVGLRVYFDDLLNWYSNKYGEE
jgi:hypothetical protein